MTLTDLGVILLFYSLELLMIIALGECLLNNVAAAGGGVTVLHLHLHHVVLPQNSPNDARSCRPCQNDRLFPVGQSTATARRNMSRISFADLLEQS